MRKLFQYIVILFIGLVPVWAYSQTNQPYEMNINGLKVIVQPTENEIVVIKTIIKGGVQNYSESKQGIESLAMSALTECGTEKDDKNSFKNKLDKVSASLYGYSDMDYATFTMNCIKADFDKVWPLYIDALTAPRFDNKEFDRIKQDAINNIRSTESSPDASINNMAKKNAFAGKNYAKDPQGTVATVSKLTAAETKTYFKSILTKSRMTIVVVGKLDKSTLEKNLNELIVKIPKGLPFVAKKENYTPVVSTFKAEKRENATNYIQGIAGGPQPGTPDYNAFVLATRIFSTRHFVEVRSKNGLSYAPGSWFSGGATPYTNISVTTTEPDKYIEVARTLIEKIKKEGFTAEELKDQKTGYLTGIYYRQETNDEQANALATNEVIHGDWKRTAGIKNDIKKVSLDDINKAFNKYLTNITWSYQGDPTKVNGTYYTQKEIPKVKKKAF
jgi:zinc protease